MKLQNLTVIFIIIILPIILLVSLYINTGLRTIRYQALYDTGLITSTQDAIQAFEINTLKNNYSDNAEMKRSIIKSSIKMFETSLCDTCNISSYNVDEIEEYIPAVVFGMSDGFYMYAPSYNPTTKRYEHSLKNYVYYSEMLDEDNAIVIRYYLDSYVHVSGYFEQSDGKLKYESQEGYLINTVATKFNGTSNLIALEDFYNNYKEKIDNGEAPIGSITYYDTEIDIADELAVNYFVDNYKFSYWFNNTVLKTSDIEDKHEYLVVSGSNDPEDPNSEFVQHKNKVIKEKIEGVLNSSITAYSKRTWGQNYKMPKLSEEDWQKIYSDISVTTFFQGKKIGFTKYNGYCVLNSNNHYELINPNLLYFSTDDDNSKSIDTNKDYYHDIRCKVIENTNSMEVTQNPGRGSITTIRGWRIGRFQKKTKDDGSYNYERAECACYECINGSISNGTSLYDYIKVAKEKGNASDFIKESYWTSLARERGKLHEDRTIPSDILITKEVKGSYTFDGKPYVINGGIATYTIKVTNNAPKVEFIKIMDAVQGTDQINNIRIERYQIKKESTVIGDYSTTKNPFEETIELRPGETVEIEYKANILDIDYDEVVTNVAMVTYSSGEKTAEATCYTTGTKLAAKKVVKNKAGTAEITKILPEENEVTYEIEITSTSDKDVVDVITIDDTFDSSEITQIKNIKFYRNNIYVGNDGGCSREKGKLHWGDIYIKKGDTIKITFNATLKGKIGKTIINKVVSESAYGSKAYAEDDIGCRIEKTVKVAVDTLVGRNIFLALDKSNSMDDYIYERVSAFDRGVGRGSYPREVREFINRVHSETTSQITGAVLFAGDTTTKIHETSELNNYNIWETDLGTRYNTALKEANERLNNGDILIFFSDGNPTGSDHVTEYPYKEEGNEWIGKDVWDSISEQLRYIKNKGVTVYAVGYDTKGETDLKGLEKVIASDENKYISGNNIDTLFNTLFNKIFSSLSLPESYASDNGKIEIEYVNRIKDIKVDGVSLSDFDSYIIDKNETNPDNVTGTLDLTRIINLTGDEEITIFYE